MPHHQDSNHSRQKYQTFSLFVKGPQLWSSQVQSCQSSRVLCSKACPALPTSTPIHWQCGLHSFLSTWIPCTSSLHRFLSSSVPSPSSSKTRKFSALVQLSSHLLLDGLHFLSITRRHFLLDLLVWLVFPTTSLYPLPEQRAHLVDDIVQDERSLRETRKRIEKENLANGNTDATSQVLHVPVQKVTRFDQDLRDLVMYMCHVMYAAQGVGLAAPQIGVQKAVIVYNMAGAPMHIPYTQMVMINPRIIETSKELVDREEGCLSLKGIYGVVRRYQRVVVEAYDIYGTPFIKTCSGDEAIIAQHEIDHLNGIVFLDKVLRSK